jgi:c-di-GMP-binding flagellar brake protein YcgR
MRGVSNASKGPRSESEEGSPEDRRRYKRVQAPVYCRPVGIGLRFRQDRALPLDISLGGMRIYSDEPVQKGTRLELELFLPDNTSVTCKVEVVWVEKLAADAPARHDVGLKFLDIRAVDRDRLAAVLDES